MKLKISKFFVLILFITVSGCATVSRRDNISVKPEEVTTLDIETGKIVEKLSKQFPENSSVLVLDFKDLNGVVTHFSKYIADKIQIALSKIQGITVVERQNLKFILEEQKLQFSGVVDEKSAVQIGKLMGSKNIVYGTIAELENIIDLNLCLISVEKSVVIGGISHKIPKTKEVASLLNNVIKTEESTITKTEQKILTFENFREIALGWSVNEIKKRYGNPFFLSAPELNVREIHYICVDELEVKRRLILYFDEAEKLVGKEIVGSDYETIIKIGKGKPEYRKTEK